MCVYNAYEDGSSIDLTLLIYLEPYLKKKKKFIYIYIYNLRNFFCIPNKNLAGLTVACTSFLTLN